MAEINLNIKDIEDLLLSLTPEQLKVVMSGMTINKFAYKIDYSIRGRRQVRTETYFKCEPKPHQCRHMTPEEYNGHREGIWEQIICQ